MPWNNDLSIPEWQIPQIIRLSKTLLNVIDECNDLVEPLEGGEKSGLLTAGRTKDEVFFPPPHTKYIKKVGMVSNDHTPYAITFTFPTDTRFDMTGARLVKDRNYINLIDQIPSIQRNHFFGQFDIWLKKLKRSLSSFMPYVSMPAMEIYTEFTQQGLIHAHGLIYINNNYGPAVSDIMASLWVKINKGVQKSAMIKRNGKLTDRAFDKCNNVTNWTKYIRKEYPKSVKDIALSPTATVVEEIF